jgi:ASC-1-like (ASCH) protein
MQELGVTTELLEAIIDGRKTIECTLGKPQYIKLRPGDQLSVREDMLKDGKIIQSIPHRATIKITQILYFETLEETFHAIDFTAAIPDAYTRDEALAAYKKLYTPEDEYEYGVMAISFKLV